MQSSFAVQDNSVLLDFVSFLVSFDVQDDCDGFLYDGLSQFYQSTHYQVTVNESESLSLQQDSTENRLPYAGEFPLAVNTIDDQLPDSLHYLSLAKQSRRAFSRYSDEEYRKWWGIQKRNSHQAHAQGTQLVNVSTGLTHFSDVVQLIEQNPHSFQEDPLCCPFSRPYCRFLSLLVILPFCCPVVVLHLHGCPPEASTGTVASLLRLFASLYWIERRNQDYVCYVNVVSAYSLIMELHAREVNGFRLWFSL